MTRGFRVTNADPVPVLADADALVVEGTLAGCVSAHMLARSGRKTILAATGCSLPHEIVVCRRPWVRRDDLARLPEPFKEAFGQSIEHPLTNGASLYNLTKLSIAVEDLLLDSGVHLFYGMSPCGVVTSDDRVTSVIFGGKFGLQAVHADCIIDTTQTAIVPRLAGCSYQLRAGAAEQVTVRLSAKVGVAEQDKSSGIDAPQAIQACPTTWPDEEIFHVPGYAALVEERVQLHGPYAEFALKLPLVPSDPLALAHLSTLARKHLLDVGIQIGAARAKQGKAPLYFHRYSGALTVDPFLRVSTNMENVRVCSAAVDLPDEQVASYANPYCLIALATEVVDQTIAVKTKRSPGNHVSLVGPDATTTDAASSQLRFNDSSQPEERTSIKIGEQVLPVLATCDVLVAGGGTSGVPAALAAAQSGANVVLIEQHADVGGTQTVGGVGNYWFGRETPHQVACDKAYQHWATESGMSREIAMLKCLTDAGVTVIAPCAMVGVLYDDHHVDGVVVATDRGLGVISGQIVIDASGDADIAAWSGVPYEFGNGRDAWTIWASFANFNNEKRTASRQYESSADVGDAHDFTRTIVRARRRQGMWSRFAHDMPQLYVAPRETRRMEGRTQITYGGILAGETFPDVMTVCDSNFDIKGIASSDLIYCGVMWGWKAHIRYLAAIPFRAIQPREVDNLLIVGRSYSASHDAQSLARMQRDMASLGAGAGIAASMSVRTGETLSELDLKALQREWVDRGTLRDEDFKHFGQNGNGYTAADAQQDAKELVERGDISADRLARLASSKASIAPLLQAFDGTDDRNIKTHIARLLCYLGDDSTVSFLKNEIAEQIQDGLPEAQAATLALPPEHGWAPEPTYSLYAIALVGAGRGVADLMTTIAHTIEDDAETFASKGASPFEYIRAICAVAERNPGREMIRPLDALLDKSCLRDLVIPSDGDMRLTADPLLERRAYLEICLGRTLARCSDRRGYDILLRYTDDIRRPLARSAADELRDLTGENNREGWQAFIEQHADKMGFKPYTKRID